MAKVDLTKAAFAGALRELIRQKPYERITVNEIADQAGLSRHTLYYHFIDKRDLVIWMFTADRRKFMRDINRSNFRSNYLNTLLYLQQDASLFIQAIQDDSQNGFREHYYSTMIGDYIRLIDSYIDGREFPEGYKQFFAHFYAAGTVETTLDFLCAPSKEVAEQLAERVSRLQETGLYATIDRIIAENAQAKS